LATGHAARHVLEVPEAWNVPVGQVNEHVPVMPAAGPAVKKAAGVQVSAPDGLELLQVAVFAAQHRPEAGSAVEGPPSQSFALTHSG